MLCDMAWLGWGLLGLGSYWIESSLSSVLIGVGLGSVWIGFVWVLIEFGLDWCGSWSVWAVIGLSLCWLHSDWCNDWLCLRGLASV